MTSPTRTFTVDQLSARVYPDPEGLGEAAAAAFAQAIRDAVADHGSARAVVATGNSQYPIIAALAGHDLPWDMVTVFHLDEYVGIDADHTASFRKWIRERVEERFHPAQVHYIDGDAPDAEAEAARYDALLREAPLDVIAMGIGENGHIAFNEPHLARFDDPQWVRVVDLDDTSRHQQVNEGHFPTFDDVPRQALSVTVPALMSAGTLVVSVPEKRKAAAVSATLREAVSTSVPATALRNHAHAILLLEPESYSDYAATLTSPVY